MSDAQLRRVLWRAAERYIGRSSYLHPDLGDLCSSVGRKTASLDLLSGKLELPGISWPPKLARVCATEGRIFAEILASEEIDRGALRSAIVEFEFQFPNSREPATCRVRVGTEKGAVLEHVAEAGYPRPERPE